MCSHTKMLRLFRYAGHFFWDQPHWLSTNARTYDEIDSPHDCFILVRDPVSRFVSCYNERFAPAFGMRPIEELTPSELDSTLVNYTDGQFGCSNEIARWLSPSGRGDRAINEGRILEEDIEETKRRIETCVVGNTVGRCADTQTVVAHWLPWLPVTCENSGHRSQRKRASTEQLPEAVRRAILRTNKLDMELYAAAMEHFEQLLMLARCYGDVPCA